MKRYLCHMSDAVSISHKVERSRSSHRGMGRAFVKSALSQLASSTPMKRDDGLYVILKSRCQSPNISENGLSASASNEDSPQAQPSCETSSGQRHKLNQTP